MKLSYRDIAAIEGFLTQRAEGKTWDEISAFYRFGKHGKQRLSVAAKLLEDLGVQVPKITRESRTLSKDDMADFREWQRQREAARKPELLRPNGAGGYYQIAS